MISSRGHDPPRRYAVRGLRHRLSAEAGGRTRTYVRRNLRDSRARRGRHLHYRYRLRFLPHGISLHTNTVIEQLSVHQGDKSDGGGIIPSP